MPPIETVEVLIFYFDLVGVVDRYTTDPSVIDEISAFQRQVRQIPTGWGEQYSCVVTAFDNVIARINVQDNAGAADFFVVEFAAKTVAAAEGAGFHKCFGAVTRGLVPVDLFDQHLVSGGDPTDLRSQHLSFLGDPHIRAAFAEKWSASLARQKALPFGGRPCVWVSEEVFDPDDLPGLADTRNPDVNVLGHFDLRQMKTDKNWPFPQSRFSGIRPR